MVNSEAKAFAQLYWGSCYLPPVLFYSFLFFALPGVHRGAAGAVVEDVEDKSRGIAGHQFFFQPRRLFPL